MATFKTRARTLDMLGRQQIAGIPTAISELFKNAHDAYADRVEIDYYRSDDLFVLRDDGIGMSHEDFVARWLTIGTESKFISTGTPPRDPDKKRRPMLGEKGIGRLAIATIGPQLLVLTRPKADGRDSDLTAAFLNWGIFAWPGIDLEEIDIPLRAFPAGTLPSAHDISEMVTAFRANAERIGRRVERDLVQDLVEELSQFDVDPQDIDSYLCDPSLSGEGCGTHFIIKPASALLADDMDGEPTASKVAALKKATPLKKALLGFSNTMTPESGSVIHTAFRDHMSDEVADDLIGEEEFFTPEEFQNTDHRISGKFDGFGQFRGEVSIYGETTPDHVIAWSGGRGTPTNCGPFSIDFAAFEGESRHSTIPYDEHLRLAIKTEQLGGLYIYRNGIRVLPYGDTDYDWLDIEFRRTKSAYYYYFSHRKMFGSVEIDAETNRGLREKAGREGFQENKAYRQFRSILQNFFLQIAADFFRADVTHADTFDLRKTELSREDAARKRRAKQVSQRKKKFEAQLGVFFDELSKGAPQAEVLELTEDVAAKLETASSIKDPQRAAHEVLQLEREAQADIRDIETRYRVSRPRIGLSKATLRDWKLYNTELASLQENVFGPARGLVEDIIGDEARKAKLSLDRRIRTEAALEDLGQDARKTTGESSRAVRNEAEKVASEARDAARRALKAVESELRVVLSEFHRLDLAEIPDEHFVETRSALETRILTITEEQSALLRSVLEQLQAIDVTGETSASEQLMAVEQRNLLLEEEAEADAQLAQLGMAIEIINHEFSGTIRSVRNGLRKLKAWADVNEGLADLYGSIRTSFDHLDGYLTLFTPLQRRLYRKAVEISGFDIHDFLEELFRARCIALTSLTAVREGEHKILDRFCGELDPAFLAHMACLPDPEEAEGQIVAHVAEEIRGLADETVAAVSPAGKRAVENWIQRDGRTNFKFGDRELNLQQTITLVTKGLTASDLAQSAFRNLSAGFASCSVDGLDEQLAWIMSFRTVYNAPPPTLWLGSVVTTEEAGAHPVLCRENKSFSGVTRGAFCRENVGVSRGGSAAASLGPAHRPPSSGRSSIHHATMVRFSILATTSWPIRNSVHRPSRRVSARMRIG